MLWHAMPPELNTARLMAGAGAAPMLAAAMGWEALAAALDAQAVELSSRLSSLGEAWTGGSSEKAIAAAMPMVAWLQTASAQAKLRAMQATAQAASYTQAMATTPSLAEIGINRITTVVLTATNFFGINTVPIAFHEMDYFVRMWTQAAVAMDVYQAATLANTTFHKLEPMTAILDPVMNQPASSAMMTQLSGVAGKAPTPGQIQQTVGQVSQLSNSMQQLTQPLQQMTSLLGQAGSTGGPDDGLGDDEGAQLGLVGTNALSNHPLAGGSGPSSGAGLLRSEALPGAGGTLARTPLMAGLIDKPAAPVVPAAAAGAGSSATGGAAPLGGAMGHGAHAGGATRSALVAPAPLAAEVDENDEAEWDDQEDW